MNMPKNEPEKITPNLDNIIVTVESKGNDIAEHQFSSGEILLTKTNAADRENFAWGNECLLNTVTITNDETIFLNPEQKNSPLKYDNLKQSGEKESIGNEISENSEKDTLRKIAHYIIQALINGKINKHERIKIDENKEISIRISKDDRKTCIRITADETKTARNIQRNIHSLREMLSKNNLSIPLFEIVVARQHRLETTKGAD